MKKYALIGCPLGHSLSPQIHEKLFSLSGERAEYSLAQIEPRDLKSKYDYLKTLDGFNVTIPHKISIIDFCTELSPEAERYGSVNCVKLDGEKRVGFNTDVIGFVRSVEQLGASLNSNVCILGCGGVGRMMALETVYQGGKLTMAVRDEDIPVAMGIKSDIAEKLPNARVSVIPLSEMRGNFDLTVNATPVGMFPNTDFSPLKKEQLKNVSFLFDAVYNPIRTKLFLLAEELGIKASTGMAMLVLQAAAAHEIWSGSHYENDDINAVIRESEALIS